MAEELVAGAVNTPWSMVHPPQDKVEVTHHEPPVVPENVAPNALDTLEYGTEYPARQTPPTNYTVATEQRPPTPPDLEPVSAELKEEPEVVAYHVDATVDDPDAEIFNMTPDVEPPPVWEGQPRATARPEPPEAPYDPEPRYAADDEDEDEDDDAEWIEEADKPAPKRGRPRKKK